jgi:O-succinylbenzoic acid--CoA ligase
MLRRLAELGLEPAPALREVLLGGAGAPRDLLEWATGRGLPVVRTYGMTETASQVAVATGTEESARALPDVELAVDAGGQVLVRGPMVARRALDEDGWLHTGDLGTIDREGRLVVHGRADDVIVTGGENVSPAEVEEALRAHPAVSDVAVVGAPDPEWGEAVVAYVVAGGNVTEEDLRSHCRGRIAAHKSPKRVRIVAELPRTAAGKVDRRALRGRLQAP